MTSSKQVQTRRHSANERGLTINMKPYGREAVAPGLLPLVCTGCYLAGGSPISRGVLCPVCLVDLCWPCMERHIKTEDHQTREARLPRRIKKCPSRQEKM